MKTITTAQLAELMWNTVIINDMFDEKLALVRDALRDACRTLADTMIVAEPDAKTRD